METISLVRVHTKEVGTRRYAGITVVLADLHLSCDWMNARQPRLAKRLADSHGAPFQVEPELQARVDRDLNRAGASGTAPLVPALAGDAGEP